MRARKPRFAVALPSCFEPVTPSHFERRLPGGKHDLLFNVVFGGDAAAARFFRVSRMTVWRWTHDRAPLPKGVAEVLSGLIQSKVAEAHEAQEQLRYYVALSPRPPRKFSGCCGKSYRRRT